LERGLPGVTGAVVRIKKWAANDCRILPQQWRREQVNTGENRSSAESQTSGERT